MSYIRDLRVQEDNGYFDERGELKEGFSWEGGPGSVATGTVRESYSVGAGRDGTQKRYRDVTIYKTGDFDDGSSKGEEEEERGFPRDTGEFEDIIGALGDDVAAANARADEYANKATQDIADNTQVITQTLNDQFTDKLAALTSGFNDRYGALEDLVKVQQESIGQFQTMMQGQMQAAQESYNQQVAMMQNMQRAQIPQAENSAFSAQIGDQRQDPTRERESNRLSDLSILSGLGTQSSPTAGLSLA